MALLLIGAVKLLVLKSNWLSLKRKKISNFVNKTNNLQLSLK